MICKDCKPIWKSDFVEPVVEAIELCDRHAEMDRNQVVLEAMIANGTEEENERRRYALLTAAATLFCFDVDDVENIYGEAVTIAEKLLKEIEQRERAEATHE